MYGDVYSTFTLAGAYANAVKAAQESDAKSLQSNPERAQEAMERHARSSLINRFKAWVKGMIRRSISDPTATADGQDVQPKQL